MVHNDDIWSIVLDTHVHPDCLFPVNLNTLALHHIQRHVFIPFLTTLDSILTTQLPMHSLTHVIVPDHILPLGQLLTPTCLVTSYMLRIKLIKLIKPN